MIDIPFYVALARNLTQSQGLTGSLTLTDPASVNGRDGTTSGLPATVTVQAWELEQADVTKRAGNGWSTATLGLLIDAALLSVEPTLTTVATWGGVAYQVVAVEKPSATGNPFLYTIGCRV